MKLLHSIGLSFILGAGIRPSSAGEPIDIGSRLEPFVDRFLVADSSGVELVLGVPRPVGVALEFDRAWEGRYCGYVTVLRDDRADPPRYRMWYRGLPKAGEDGSDAEVVCTAESADGVRWEKPSLGLFEVADETGAPTRENNVVLAGAAPFAHNFAPFLDGAPGVPESERFKALAGVSSTGLLAFASADGLRWRKLRDEPVLREGAFDSQNVSFHSATEGRYVCYFRTWTDGEFAGFRTVSRATSEDFLSWSAGIGMDFGGAPPEHLYTNQTSPFFRAPHLYVATAARFMPGRRAVTAEESEALGGESSYSGDCSDTVLITSRGGERYDRTFMEGFVRPGLGASNWTSRTNYVACGIVPTGSTGEVAGVGTREGEEMSLYVQRDYGRPTHRLERLALRTDGLASMRAPYAGGWFETKPLAFRGARLALNVATSAAGGVRVEIRDAATNEPVPGFALADCVEIVGDAIERVVRWSRPDGASGDVSALAGRAVRLRFEMKDADVYSLRFDP